MKAATMLAIGQAKRHAEHLSTQAEMILQAYRDKQLPAEEIRILGTITAKINQAMNEAARDAL